MLWLLGGSAPRAIDMTKICVLAPWCFIHFHAHSFPSVPRQGAPWLCLALLRAKHFLIYVLINLTERPAGWEPGLRASLCAQAGFLPFHPSWSREREAGAVGGSGSSGGGSGCAECERRGGCGSFRNICFQPPLSMGALF